MKTLISRSVTSAAAILIAFVLLGAMTLLIGENDGTLGATALAEVQAEELAAPALRAISIPYGISSVLTVTEDGSRLFASGHAVCWDDGQMFDLQVRVAQSSTGAFAVGQSIDNCAGGERQMWDAEAAVIGSIGFEVGEARACAEAVEFAKHGIADEYRWCKDILLIRGPS